jgi:hypothetical protein
MLTRPAAVGEGDAIWKVMKPIIRAGETYTLPRDMDKQAALAYWLYAEHEVFVAEENGAIVGTYFLQANQQGGGGHVANCGYMTAVSATGRRRAGNVHAFAGSCSRTRISRHAIQFRGEHERARGAIVAKL